MLDRSKSFDAALDLAGSAAFDEDRGASPETSVREIIRDGPFASRDSGELSRALAKVAERNLSVARIVEGHVNALKLLRQHDMTPDDDAIYGVWGAEGDPPVSVKSTGRLTGTKRYCSGLGTVSRAIVTVRKGEDTFLALIDVMDGARHQASEWDMLGMRASRSGGFVLDGLDPEWLGGANDYFVEPAFLGGTWRIAALQTGGTLGLIGAARDALRARDRLESEAQIARLGTALAEALAALALTERAALVAEGQEGITDPERAVALSLSARLHSERVAQATIAMVERSLGLPHFEISSETGRIARDLATYCRQVAGDALLQKAGRIALGRNGPLSRFWYA